MASVFAFVALSCQALAPAPWGKGKGTGRPSRTRACVLLSALVVVRHKWRTRRRDASKHDKFKELALVLESSDLSANADAAVPDVSAISPVSTAAALSTPTAIRTTALAAALAANAVPATISAAIVIDGYTGWCPLCHDVSPCHPLVPEVTVS